MSRINFTLHRFSIYLDWSIKPVKSRRRRVRSNGFNWYAQVRSNRYWNVKAKRLQARFRHDL